MPTNAEVLDQAMARLGNRRSDTLRASVLSEINTAIDDLERGKFFPWFLQDIAELSISVGDTYKALPSNFAREEEETRPYYVDSEGNTQYLTKRFYAVLQGETPLKHLTYYAIRGNNIHFQLAATGAVTLYVPYYARQTGNMGDNSAEVSNLWLINARNWVLGKALTVVASNVLQNKELAGRMAAFEKKAMDDIFVYHESREHTNHDYEVGGVSDGS